MAKYTDHDRATALATLDANGGNVKATARATGVPEATIRMWRDTPPVSAEARAQKKQDLAAELEAIALQLVGAMSTKIADASLQQVATSLGIAIDKMQLLQGKPTSRTATVVGDFEHKTDAELDAIIADAERLLRGDSGTAGTR